MEFVYVVPRGELFPDCYPQGLVRFQESSEGPPSKVRFEAIVRRHGFFVERDHAERNPALKQIIPYTVVQVEDRVLLLRRLRTGGERRLHDKLSIGVGGHINPVDLSEGREAFLHLRGYWMVAHQLRHLDRLDELGDNVAGNVRAGLEVTTRQYAWAEQVRGRIWEYFVGFFERYDYLVTPAMAVRPFPVEQSYPETVAGRSMKNYVDWIAPTFVLSLTGLPVGSAPCGLDAEGLPVGLQIVGPPSGEEAVLALSRLVHERHPLGEPPLNR